MKSGKLIEFLAQWDSKHNTVPQRMEQLWIDLYERGYIEETDILSLQKWIGALNQIGYEFPPLKRRFRNVAVMGQFNYADKPSVFHDVMFWVQKNREQFDTVLAAGPFSEDQMSSFKEHSIDVVQGKDDRGFYSPLENQMNTLLRFKDSDKIDGVVYVHDDGIMNITELSQGKVSSILVVFGTGVIVFLLCKFIFCFHFYYTQYYLHCLLLVSLKVSVSS